MNHADKIEHQKKQLEELNRQYMEAKISQEEYRQKSEELKLSIDELTISMKRLKELEADGADGKYFEGVEEEINRLTKK